MEPISTEPKPRPASADIAEPLLSKPAASPIGVGKMQARNVDRKAGRR